MFVFASVNWLPVLSTWVVYCATSASKSLVINLFNVTVILTRVRLRSEMPWNKGVAVLLATTTISKLDAQWRTHMVNNSEAQSPEFGVTSPAQSSNSSEQ
ncbi:TPA: hypothetical protein ACH3X1_002006 [Trebouxia sp. C0004]